MSSLLVDTMPPSWSSSSSSSSSLSSLLFSQQKQRTCLHSTMLVQEEEEFQVQEDETSLRVILELPGVRGKDIAVDFQPGLVTIRGSRCVRDNNNNTTSSGHSSSRILKRQRLSRQFTIDDDLVDVERAVANICNGVLVLYAPKRSKLSTSTSVSDATAIPTLEFFTAAAQRLRSVEQQQQQQQQLPQQQLPQQRPHSFVSTE